MADEAKNLLYGEQYGEQFMNESCLQLNYKEKKEVKELNRISRFRKLQEMIPEDFKNILDSHIVGQEDAKRTLAVALYKHCQNFFIDKVSKSNVLVFGPSGSGKTDMARCLSKALGLPFVLYDATKLTEAGFAGDDASDMIKQLYYAAGCDTELAEHGIVYIDEIDKLAGTACGDVISNGREVGKTGAQQAMLRILEDDTVAFSVSTKNILGTSREVSVNTRNILFIGAGALVKKEEKNHSIGFIDQKASESITKEEVKLSARDCIEFGFIPEFIRRFSKITQTHALTEQELIAVLSQKDGNILEQYKRFLYENGIQLSWTESFLKEAAKMALAEPTGVSALKSILDDVMDDLLFNCLNSKMKRQIKLTEKYLKREGGHRGRQGV